MSLACSLWTRDAAARDGGVTPEPRVAARKLAAEGSDAFAAKDFEKALTLFNQAAELVAAPTITLMQARVLAELGRLTAAAERYEAARALTPEQSANAAFRDAAETAVSELTLLKQRIPTLRIRIEGLGAQSAEVLLDGQPLAPEAVKQEQLVDPGPHRVEVEASSGTSAARLVTLVEGAREEVVFSLEPAVRVPASAPPAPVAPREPSEPARTRLLPWLTIGAGVALVGTGATLGVIALGHKSNLDDVCHPGCPYGYDDRLSTYRTERNLAYLALGLGAGGIATGVVLLGNQPNERKAAVTLGPGSVTLGGSF